MRLTGAVLYSKDSLNGVYQSWGSRLNVENYLRTILSFVRFYGHAYDVFFDRKYSAFSRDAYRGLNIIS